MDKKYHINVSQEDIENSKYCLICGDPARVPRISTLLKDSEEISFNREFRVHLGYLKDQPIVVSSMGIGCPSTAIGIEEFGQIGVHTIIRVGTSGILSRKVKIGDIVSGTGAIRDEGTSRQYIDYAYPAVANVDVVLALRQAAHNLNLSSRFHEGIIHSKDAFYAETPSLIPDPTIKSRWDSWIKGGALVTEMESSTIFVICQIRGWRAGGIMAAIGDVEAGELIVDHTKGQKEAIEVAIEATKILL
ncbi:MAG: nucleoside phosphorylase [Candidatus Heimdallarchaeota archaeon]|nr:MAG: nucleoside phosphorylase [Candidatus Heimdallarchaeota archaeon]